MRAVACVQFHPSHACRDMRRTSKRGAALVAAAQAQVAAAARVPLEEDPRPARLPFAAVRPAPPAAVAKRAAVDEDDVVSAASFLAFPSAKKAKGGW